jgi:ribosomal protein S18 acetylase RimI-like enzyme
LGFSPLSLALDPLSFLIRQFQFPQDYDSVLTVWQAGGPGLHVGFSDTREEVAKKLTHDPDLFLVVEEQAKIVGAVVGGFDGRRGLVYHLAVLPEHRGHGLGTALLTELEARLKAKGCLKAYLLVVHENAEVLDFYQKRGWGVMEAYVVAKEFRG